MRFISQNEIPNPPQFSQIIAIEAHFSNNQIQNGKYNLGHQII